MSGGWILLFRGSEAAGYGSTPYSSALCFFLKPILIHWWQQMTSISLSVNDSAFVPMLIEYTDVFLFHLNMYPFDHTNRNVNLQHAGP